MTPNATQQRAWLAYGLLAILLLLLPFLINWGMGRFWLRVIDFALLYAMLALGLNIVVGFAGLLDLGYVAFMPSAPMFMRCLPRRTSISICLSGHYCP